MANDRLARVLAYHERTKHHLHGYARSLGYLDWATQPEPFRRFEADPVLPLDLPGDEGGPPFDDVLAGRRPPPAPLDRAFVSRLFLDSLALSAWKEAGTSRWSLRVNPSSGNLHPTEGYLVAPAIAGLTERPAVHHYQPFLHALEVRCELTDEAWPSLALPPGAVLVGLTSIHWREAWKYGERAWRYCQHDAGHAIAALALSATALGWRARLVERATHDELAALLGTTAQSGPEAEHPDALLALWPGEGAPDGPRIHPDLLGFLRAASWSPPEPLSLDHHPWPIIDDVAEATCVDVPPPDAFFEPLPDEAPPGPTRDVPFRPLVRRRRSAVAMDGKTGTTREAFHRMLEATRPERAPGLFGALPWRPFVDLALFVHRVEGLPRGLYLLLREPSREDEWRRCTRSEFVWTTPGGTPEHLPLRLLAEADARDAARLVSCHQDIASDGAFAVGMLARFDEPLRTFGPWVYPRLFRETGAVGQALYLAAEAEGLRATGIGCFFDDAMHAVLGLESHAWQSLYHFTIGGAVDDPRLRTAPPYGHRDAALAELGGAIGPRLA